MATSCPQLYRFLLHSLPIPSHYLLGSWTYSIFLSSLLNRITWQEKQGPLQWAPDERVKGFADYYPVVELRGCSKETGFLSDYSPAPTTGFKGNSSRERAAPTLQSIIGIRAVARHLRLWFPLSTRRLNYTVTAPRSLCHGSCHSGTGRDSADRHQGSLDDSTLDLRAWLSLRHPASAATCQWTHFCSIPSAVAAEGLLLRCKDSLQKLRPRDKTPTISFFN